MYLLNLLAVGALCLAITGCSSLPAFLGGHTKNIEAFFTAQAAGLYKVSITKDGKVLFDESWECTKSEDGSTLTGCHKQTKP